MRIVFVLCEGIHDVTFLARLLKTEGYDKYKKMLKQFPQPLDQWLTNISKNLRVEELRLHTMTDDIKAVLPKEALYSKATDQLILLYCMNGDKQKEKRGRVISKLSEFTCPPANDKEFSWQEESSEDGNNYGLVVFFDADELGVDQRIVEAKDELAEYFPTAASISNNGSIVSENGMLKLAVYVFADPSTKKGTLENILLPLMKEGNERIFKDAEDFLESHHDSKRLNPLVIKKDAIHGIVEVRDKPQKYDPSKSIIGVVGQLQISGASNTVCIEKADYLTLAKIRKNRICRDILHMFSSL